MTLNLVRLIGDLRRTFRTLSVEALYHVALQLRHELAERGLDCAPEADALVCALLAHARTEHRAIYSADCSAAEPARVQGHCRVR